MGFRVGGLGCRAYGLWPCKWNSKQPHRVRSFRIEKKVERPYRQTVPQLSMLRVWLASGRELAALPVVDMSHVMDLKRHLRTWHGYPVCLQELLQAEGLLENSAPLDGPVDVQLVVLSILKPDRMAEAANELVEYAAETGHVEVARALLEAGADKDFLSSSGMTALMQASSKGHLEVVRLLLQAGAEQDMQQAIAIIHVVFEYTGIAFQPLGGQAMSEIGMTALMFASSAGHMEIVRLLLEASADKNVRDENGMTALMLASSAGHVEIAGLLLEAGASKNLSSTLTGRTALMFASSAGHVETVRLLLEAGADKNLRSMPSSRTALMFASLNGYVEVVRLLLSDGADKNEKDWNGKTALMLASSAGHVEIVRLLLDAGADKNRMSLPFGRTALMLASSEGHVEIVRLLLEAGADKNLRDLKCMTALMLAASAGHVELARLLRDAGAGRILHSRVGAATLVPSGPGHSIPARQVYPKSQHTYAQMGGMGATAYQSFVSPMPANLDHSKGHFAAAGTLCRKSLFPR